MMRRNSPAAAAARAARDRRESVTRQEFHDIIDLMSDAEPIAIDVIRYGAVRFETDGDALISVAGSCGHTANRNSLSVQGPHHRSPWPELPAIITAASVARPLFCLRHRPTLTRRLLGDDMVASIEKAAEVYFTEGYRGLSAHPPDVYTSKLVSRRLWTSRDFPNSRSPWPDDPPSLREHFLANRRVVRGWSSDHLDAVLARAEENKRELASDT